AGHADEALQQIAEHYARSGERERAVRYLVRAGDRWASLFAYEEARADYARALDALEAGTAPSVERASILEKLGDVAGAGSQLGAADVMSHAYNTWGVALARAGDIERGAELVAQSLETALARQLGAVACRAYTNLAVMYATLDHSRSVDYCREGLALAQRIGDQLQQSWLYCTLAGGHCTLSGDYDGGVQAAEAAVELDRRLGQRHHLPIPLIILGQIHQCRGAWEESAACYRQALQVAEEVGEPQLLFPCYDGLATLAIERGDEDEAERWLARSREVQAATGWS